MKNNIVLLLFLLSSCFTFAKHSVYEININDEINSKSWVYIQKGFAEAHSLPSDLIVIHLNTYGGELSYADSIRTTILNSDIPVVAFIDNNAASAGALISIACDRIYMRKGSSLGAATVVSGSDGTQMPDKYQSYMRAMMRSTAESHGKDSLGKWIRNPLIAEAMVDSRTVVPNLIDSTRTLTFSTQEAIKWNYCDGEAETIHEVLKLEGFTDKGYSITTYRPTFMHIAMGILTSTALQAILIMLILGGIYFELQTPGVGFPLIVAIIAALLYFAPLYIEGLALNWEIILFFIGVLLIILEIFVVPGFGITGISGILLVIVGLVFSLINNVNFNFDSVSLDNLVEALITVVLGLLLAVVGIVFLSSRIGHKGLFRKLALESTQLTDEGYIGVPIQPATLVHRKGIVASDLRPVGKVMIDNELFDAIAESGFINKGTEVYVVKYSTGQLVVRVS